LSGLGPGQELRTMAEAPHGIGASPPENRAQNGEGQGVEAAFDRTVEEGAHRVGRTWPGLLATGAVGGIDVGLGVLALALVLHDTGSRLLGGLGFGIGFIALTLANSELFTEDFLVPIAALVAGRATWTAVVWLWVGTLVMNLIGGWVMMGVVVVAVPDVRGPVVKLGTHFVAIGHGRVAFAVAVLGGSIITLMTWMQHSTDSIPGRLVAAVMAAFLLAAGSLNHAMWRRWRCSRPCRRERILATWTGSPPWRWPR
jgi:formate-nitrite transporter family protein